MKQSDFLRKKIHSDWRCLGGPKCQRSWHDRTAAWVICAAGSRSLIEGSSNDALCVANTCQLTIDVTQIADPLKMCT